MLIFEYGLVLVALIVALTYPAAGSRFFNALESGAGKLARRRWLSVLVVAALPIFIRLTLLHLVPFPVPTVHDEFSYLLAADTFAHGRLTNPTHPMWVHFETIHVLQQPTYASMYFPAQGLFLAAGQVLMGHPYYGVLLSVGLMCGAICWMLQGWVPARWGLLGGLLAVTRFGVWSYWANSYYGGAPAAAGGALVLGALPRIIRRQRLCDALIMGLGLAVLANSRPYEGLIFSLPFAGALLVWTLGKKHPPFGILVRRVVIPISFVLALTGAGMGYYFYRVTGNPFKMPETLNYEIYHLDGHFFWQSEGHPRPFRDVDVKWYYEKAGNQFLEAKKTGIIAESIVKLIMVWSFYVGPIFTLPLLAWAAIAPRNIHWSQLTPKLRFLFTVLTVTALGLILEVFYVPHYAAPMASAVLLLVLASMRHLRLWHWRGELTGLSLVRAVPSMCFVILLLPSAPMPRTLPPPHYFESWCCGGPYLTARARIQEKLENTVGSHLVIVQYAPRGSAFEWVYNGADIDGSKVIWAQDMGAGKNAELIQYFNGRYVWLLRLGEFPPDLMPYPYANTP